MSLQLPPDNTPDKTLPLRGYPPANPPQVVVIERPARRGPWDVAFRLLGALVMLLLVAFLGVMLLMLASLADLGDRLGGGLGGVGSAAERAGDAIGGAAQGFADRFDPAHPPRGQMDYDTEFDALRVVEVGQELGRTDDYVFTLARIEKREGVDSPELAQYAVVHREYIEPRETRVFGQTVRTDRGEADYYLYKGESFRLGHDYFKVNWVSVEEQAMATARYRNADGVTAPLKFEGD